VAEWTLRDAGYACSMGNRHDHPRSAGASPPRISLPNLRAAWWTLRAAQLTRRRLRNGGLDTALPAPSPPALPSQAERGVHAVLRRRGESCLVRSIVLQAWYAAHGDRRDLIVGVTDPAAEFTAHAWLEGEPAHGPDLFHELTRRPAQ
jgi:hypothetical protein